MALVNKIKRKNIIIILIIYGLLLQVYLKNTPRILYNYFKENRHIVICFQAIALNIDWISTCVFHLSLHSFLFKVEIIIDYLERNLNEYRIILVIFNKMKVSRISFYRLIALGGTLALDFMNNKYKIKIQPQCNTKIYKVNTNIQSHKIDINKYNEKIIHIIEICIPEPIRSNILINYRKFIEDGGK